MSDSLTLLPALSSTSERLQLLYADAAPLSVGTWRLALGFAAPAEDRPDPTAANIDIPTIHVRSTEADRAVLEVTSAAWAVPGRVLTVDVALHGASTMAGTYVISIDDPERVDPAVNSTRFALPDTAPADAPAKAAIDYLTKDYVGFRQHLLDSVSRLMPSWQDTSEPDLGVTIIESLAYGADFLSYYQDAVATEAYLDTARQRVSVRRHMRLLGATLSEGCASRLFMRITLRSPSPLLVPAGCSFVTAPDAPAVVETGDDPRILSESSGQPPIFYHQLADTEVRPELNSLPLAVDTGVLQAGAIHFPVVVTSLAHLARHAPGRIFGVSGSRWVGGPPVLHPFKVRHVTAPPSSRSVDNLAILVADPEDALPWPLHVRAGSDVTGNLIVAEFGRQITTEYLPVVVDADGYRPTLKQPYVVPIAGYRPDASAAKLLEPDPTTAAAAITLRQFIPDADGGVAMQLEGVWRCVPDLLQSTADARHFVAETGSDGMLHLRFGDGVFGRRPAVGTAFVANYRVGFLPTAVAGQGLLDTIIPRRPDEFDALNDAIHYVSNPVPSKGLIRADDTRAAIQSAKAGFRIVASCVTAEDYRVAAEAVPGVAEAAVRLERAGAVEVVVVRVRAPDQLFVAEAQLNRVRAAIDRRLIAGRRVLVAGPRFARLRLAVQVTPAPGTSPDWLRTKIADAFSTQPGGLFAPSALTFGAPVFASRVLEQLLAIEGVAQGSVTVLDRLGRTPASPPLAMLPLAWDEIPVLLPAALDIQLGAAS